MKRNRGRRWWIDADNDWWIAGILCLAALLLGGLTVRIDQALDLEPSPNRLWLYGGDASGAIGVLSAIASSSITVAGVVFSANFVALQLASSLYSPRVIWTLMRRPWLQVVLGTFLATFVYSLMVLRSVRSETDAHPEFTPVLGVSIAILLALASVAVLVFYIHRGAKTIQPAAVIEIAATESFRLLGQDLAPLRDRLEESSPAEFEPVGEGAAISSIRSGYIQRLHAEDFAELDTGQPLWIRVDCLVGQFMLTGETFATVYPASAVDDHVRAVILDAFVIGNERTPEQDVEYGFRRVADIALKALSPAINDPTTAMTCIDSLGMLLTRLALHPATSDFSESRPISRVIGNVTIRWNSHFFSRCVDVAFAQIRHYGANDPVLMAYLIETIRRVEALVPERERPALHREAIRAKESALAVITLPDDRQRVEVAARWLEEPAPAG